VIGRVDDTEALAVPAQLPAVPPSEDRAAQLPEPHPPQHTEPLAITVIDAGGAPVADALVEVWDPPSRKDAMREAFEKSGLLTKAQGDLAGEAMKQFLKDVRDLIPDPTWEPPRLTLRTASDGRCELGDPTSTTILVASKADVGTSGIWAAVPAPMTLRLQPSGHVHGVVKDAEDRPVGNATVRMYIPTWKLGEGGARTPPSVQSNERGEFEVAVDAGALGSATALRGAPEEKSSEDVFSVKAGETEEVVLLFAHGTISGRVEWDDGEPASRSAVQANLQDDAHWDSGGDPMIMEWTEKDGSFRLDHLRPGRRYRLSVGISAPAYVSAERHDVETGATGVVLVLARKDSEGATLRGRVIDMETGAPVPKFDTVLTPWHEGFRSQSPSTRKGAHENEDGRFELPRLPAAWRWAVEIQAPGHEPAIFGPIRPAEQPEFEFAIGRAGGLSVEIVDADGRPVAGAKVDLFNELTRDGRDLTSPEVTAVTDGDGRATWESLPPGRRWLAARSAPGRLGPVIVTVPSGNTGLVRGQLDSMQPPGSMTVFVLDREGRPLSGVGVHVVTTNATGDEDEAPVPTDAWGNAVAQDLRPGVYAVSVWTDELTILPRYVVVEPGAAIRVELRP
jgi:protocatechuate 3,4-dioxygenase beta subunit